MTNLLELRDVTLAYGRTRALDGVTLRVEEGDLLAVLGPDGAGKSTLARVLAGLGHPQSGTVERRVDPGMVGYAGADFDLYEDLTVEENLTFFAGVRGLRQEEGKKAADRLLELTDLEEARERLAGRLSGGMKKKLSLAAALIHRPRLMILDEPTAGVDPVSRRELWDVIAEANARGTAVVYTSPYLEEVTRARRTVLMRNGRLEEVPGDRLDQDPGGMTAWIVGTSLGRPELRGRLARADLGPRAYLRQEGLTVLARDRAGAEALAFRVLGESGVAVEPAPLNLDDVFVLMEERWTG